MRKRCRWALCNLTTLEGQNYCEKHLPRAQEKYRAYSALYDQRRNLYDGQYKAFYNSAEWKALRIEILAANPFCIACHRAWATECHHVVPLKEDWAKRLDRDNIRPWCKPCHTRHEVTTRTNKQ